MSQEDSTSADIFSIAEVIFNNEPYGPRTIELSLEENTDTPTLFEILSLFLLEGIEILIKRGKIDSAKLDVEDKVREYCQLLNKYMRSIGFDITRNIQIDDGKIEMKDSLSFETRKNYIFKVNALYQDEIYRPYITDTGLLTDLVLCISTGKYILKISFDNAKFF
jgi:hypothetical protein